MPSAWCWQPLWHVHVVEWVDGSEKPEGCCTDSPAVKCVPFLQGLCGRAACCEEAVAPGGSLRAAAVCPGGLQPCALPATGMPQVEVVPEAPSMAWVRPGATKGLPAGGQVGTEPLPQSHLVILFSLGYYYNNTTCFRAFILYQEGS